MQPGLITVTFLIPSFTANSFVNFELAITWSALARAVKTLLFNEDPTGWLISFEWIKQNDLVLFGNHTTAKKVSIENFNFKAISVKNLNDLDVNTVLKEAKAKLDWYTFLQFSPS